MEDKNIFTPEEFETYKQLNEKFWNRLKYLENECAVIGLTPQDDMDIGEYTSLEIFNDSINVNSKYDYNDETYNFECPVHSLYSDDWFVELKNKKHKEELERRQRKNKEEYEKYLQLKEKFEPEK